MLTHIPDVIAQEYDVEVLVIDDASTDETVKRAVDTRLAFPMTVFNPIKTLGYGGNQKVGYRYALKHGFDFVALLHADGQYALNACPSCCAPSGMAARSTCFGSRLMNKGGLAEAACRCPSCGATTS